MEIEKTASDPKSVLPHGSIFRYAWRSIWDGKFSLIPGILEIILWTYLAVDFGLNIFTYHGFDHYNGDFNLSYWLVVILTPVLIGMFAYRVNIETRESNEILNTVPLKPFQIMLPRMTVVLLSWLRVLLPLIILLIVTHELCYMHDIHHPFERWLRTAYWQAMVFPYEGPTCWRYGIFFEPSFPLSRLDDPNILLMDKLSPGWIAMVLLFGFSRIIGWVTLPLTWGFCIMSFIKKQPGFYLLLFILYLAILGILISLDNVTLWKYSIFNFEFQFPHIAYSYLYLLTSPLALVLSVIIYNVTLDIMERRSS